jgi:hypothetical protein
MRGFTCYLAALSAGFMFLNACETGRHHFGAPEGMSVSGARDPKFFRESAPHAHETIFSPLNLPTPSTVRTAAGIPGPDYWQQQVNYSIDASLDETAREVSGKAVVTYINNSPQKLDYLWLHLEQNLFRRDSIGALSSEPDTRFGYRGFDGGIKIKSVKTGIQDLKLTVYDTVGRLEIPKPIDPKGGKFEFEIEWSFKIPPFGADRMGTEDLQQGVVFEIAQWFPAACVFDDYHGWNTLPYLGQGEFYTNFGDFDIRLTVPHSHIVACSGTLENAGEVLTKEEEDRLTKARKTDKPVMIVAPEEVGKPESRPRGDGPLTWKFHAEKVRSVAWASSQAFIWDACYLNESGPTGSDGNPTGTLVQSVYPKEALPLWAEKSSDDLRFSIDHYNRMWHRFPYPVATNVNGIVGGMEYPMIIFCGGRHDERGLYGVTTHEIGHNWFPMLINTDERRHAWMDEGFNSFVNIYSNRARYPGDQPNPDEMHGFALQNNRAQQQPMDTAADAIWRGRLGFLEYEKTAKAMQLLREQVLGPERFDPAFRRYIDQWAFKSPRPADFFRCMEDAAGMDLAWFWRGFFLETGDLDQAVTDVGYTADGKAALVTFTNLGELVMPAVYRVTYDDGAIELRRLPVEAWMTTNQWTAAWDCGGKKIVKVELDPEHKLPDLNPANNVWGK